MDPRKFSQQLKRHMSGVTCAILYVLLMSAENVFLPVRQTGGWTPSGSHLHPGIPSTKLLLFHPPGATATAARVSRRCLCTCQGRLLPLLLPQYR